MEQNKKQFPEGHFVGWWMGICLAVFCGLVIPIAFITEYFAFIGIGPAIGVSVGLAIGSSIENKHKKEGRIRPLTKAEKKKRMILVAFGLATFALGVVVFLMRYFS